MSGLCNLCPRACGVDRQAGRVGFCGAGPLPVVAHASLHMWEEPCLSGTRGSGTVFFGGCSLRCVFCQNREISHEVKGAVLTPGELADVFLLEQKRGAHNINLVTPTHFTTAIVDALDIARSRGLRVPVVWNSSGYELPEALEPLRGRVNVFLPDFKYMSSELSTKYSGAPDYALRAKAAIAKMVELVPEPVFDDEGLMLSGVIVRCLLLPGCLEDAKKILKYLHLTYGRSIYISIMSQYTPFGDLGLYPELSRRVTRREYERLLDYAVALGIENGFTQDRESAQESFIPSFFINNSMI